MGRNSPVFQGVPSGEESGRITPHRPTAAGRESPVKIRSAPPRVLPSGLAALLLGALLLSIPGGATAEEDVPAPPAAPQPKRTAASTPFRGGVCWVGTADRTGLQYLADQGVPWLSVTPFAYGHRDAHQPPEGGYRPSRFRGESREGIAEVIDVAHELELRVLLKPHIWFNRNGQWRGDISMRSDEDWAKWFAMYREFLDPFIDLAVEKKVAAFCIGCELAGTVGRTAEWRALIEHIRGRYSGELTFAANWHAEYEAIQSWSDLDWIGIQAYFPLTPSKTPTVDDLRQGWLPWKRSLESFAKKQKKPIVFTEIGYRPEIDNGREPWGWRVTGERDPAAQERAYRALFDTFNDTPWMEGMHIWKWFAGISPGDAARRRRGHDSFSPQGMPAEALIFETFRRWEAARTPKQEAPKKKPPQEGTPKPAPPPSGGKDLRVRD